MSGSSNKTLALNLVLYLSPCYHLSVPNVFKDNLELSETAFVVFKNYVPLFTSVFLADFNFISSEAGNHILAFTVKEISVVSMVFFILLLALWFYRRYELLRITNNKRDLIMDATSKEQPKSNPGVSIIKSAAERKMFYCLFCLLKNHYDNIIVADKTLMDENGWHKLSDAERDDFFMSGFNKDLFCDFLCMVNKKCYFPVNVLSPKAINSDPLVQFNYSSEILHYNHFETSTNENSMMRPADTNHQHLKYKILHPSVPVFSAYDQAFLRKMGEIIELNYTNTRFSVEQLAYNLNLSVSQVNRRLKALTDYPAGHLLRVFRLHRAAGLIFSKAGSISEICFNTGFNSQTYFCRAFKKQFGYSPSVYRKIVTDKSMFLRQ